jgi:hypothetical protein
MVPPEHGDHVFDQAKIQSTRTPATTIKLITAKTPIKTTSKTPFNHFKKTIKMALMNPSSLCQISQ